MPAFSLETFFYKKSLSLYWLVLAVHCILQYYKLPYVVLTKPMLIPLLFIYILMRDPDISDPRGKFLYYIGLMLAFLGDLLLVFMTDTTFLIGMVAFMLMNLFYSISFLHIHRGNRKNLLAVLLVTILLLFIANAFYRFLENEMGDYKYPVLGYMVSISIMVILAVNCAGNFRHRHVVISYLIPGVLIFLIENILVAVNKFHFNRNKEISVVVMVAYCLAQYLILRGMLQVYPPKNMGKPT